MQVLKVITYTKGYSQFIYMCMGCCEHGNEPLASIKGEEFVDELSDY